jgi:hypothetical protein
MQTINKETNEEKKIKQIRNDTQSKDEMPKIIHKKKKNKSFFILILTRIHLKRSDFLLQKKRMIMKIETISNRSIQLEEV